MAAGYVSHHLFPIKSCSHVATCMLHHKIKMNPDIWKNIWQDFATKVRTIQTNPNFALAAGMSNLSKCCSKAAKNLARMRWWSFQRAPNNTGRSTKITYVTPPETQKYTFWKLEVGRWTEPFWRDIFRGKVGSIWGGCLHNGQTSRSRSRKSSSDTAPVKDGTELITSTHGSRIAP